MKNKVLFAALVAALVIEGIHEGDCTAAATVMSFALGMGINKIARLHRARRTRKIDTYRIPQKGADVK